MNEADANQLLNTMETALRQEVSSALVRRNIIGAGSINGGVVSKRTLVKRDDDGDSDSSSSDDDDDDNARISQSNLNEAEKRVWTEIQTAAETDLMTDLIASTDLALIFGLLENMNEADADQLLNTLETELRQKTAAIVTKRDNDNNEFAQLLGTHANYYSNLNDAEKKIWDAMKDASNQNRLTQFIADNGYGVVFSLAENMSITEFNTFIHMLEQQLQKEAAMAATV
ncbi:hypothetical protein EGW08_008741 [Elysia chlorotica]|uniref:Uncharacterized protein n=1 Tax=Elysia chlorotica TaxID=188477 RepID=A0A3S1A5T1_ELYCH|nr:hypothetical protein EGW08_008741 [Elysia chlorotica]